MFLIFIFLQAVEIKVSSADASDTTNQDETDDKVSSKATANEHIHESVVLTEYVDLRDRSTSITINENLDLTFPELENWHLDSSSECRRSSLSASTEDVSSVKSKSMKSCASVCKKTANNSNNKSMFVGCKRTEADIVKDVEAEIQDRVYKRKQQLVQQAGGAEHHTRLQQRAQARSPGGQLRRVLTELNEKRTTSELWQMAVEKNHLQRDRFVSPFVQVH